MTQDELIDQLTCLVRSLGGELSVYPDDPKRYRAQKKQDRPSYLWLRLTGDKPRVFPPRSVQLFTKWNDEFEQVGAKEGNHWFGQVSADLVVRPESPEEVQRGIDFVRLAYKALIGNWSTYCWTPDQKATVSASFPWASANRTGVQRTNS
jgi:hypothetical protein